MGRGWPASAVVPLSQAASEPNALGWYLVQLAPWAFSTKEEAEIAPVRAVQVHTALLSRSRIAFATAADLGDIASPLKANSIHPRGKTHLGRRLARAVLAEEYGAPLLWRGPLVLDARPAANVTSAAEVLVRFHPESCARGALVLIDPGTCPLRR